MQRIVPCLMFVGDKAGRAEEAMERYVALFADARVLSVDRFGPDDGESGIRHARLELAGREFAIQDSAGPHEFTFTPAISMVVEFDQEAELDAVYAGLSDGGQVLMPLQAYPWSPKFAWLADRYGVTWQLSLVG